MKTEREELEQPETRPSIVYSDDTDKAILAELRRGADPYKLARYFDVNVNIVLKAQRRVKIIDKLIAMGVDAKDGDI